jgi:hypothetical protein
VPNTFVKIQTITVGSGGAANIEFTSIPQTYTDLLILISMRTTRSATVDAINVGFNGGYANLSNRELYGSGTGAASGADPSSNYVGYVSGNTATASVFGNGALYIPNYTSANFKSSSGDSVSENNGSQAFQSFEANLFSNTAAITSIKLASYLANDLMQYSTATLYGIKSS